MTLAGGTQSQGLNWPGSAALINSKVALTLFQARPTAKFCQAAALHGPKRQTSHLHYTDRVMEVWGGEKNQRCSGEVKSAG